MYTESILHEIKEVITLVCLGQKWNVGNGKWNTDNRTEGDFRSFDLSYDMLDDRYEKKKWSVINWVTSDRERGHFDESDISIFPVVTGELTIDFTVDQNSRRGST